MQTRFRRFSNSFTKIHYHAVSAVVGDGINDLRDDLQVFIVFIFNYFTILSSI